MKKRTDCFCLKVYHPPRPIHIGYSDKTKPNLEIFPGKIALIVLFSFQLRNQGPKGENMGSITQPLPSQYLIFRAPSEAAGKCWMDALELALRCSSLLMRSMRDGTTLDPTVISQSFSKERGLNESEIENTHFKHEGKRT